MDIIAKKLENMGFEPKETLIYLAILKLGKATITDISRSSRIKRTTIYEYLDNLESKGLIYRTAKGKRIQYLAESPSKIGKIIERRKNEFEKIFPELDKIYSVSSFKPKVRFYEGKVGIKAIYDEMTNTSQIVYGTFSARKYFEIFSEDDNEKFFNAIKNSGGQIKDLVENSPIGKKHMKGKFYEGVGTSKLLPIDFNLSVDTMVTGDKMAMISLDNLVGIIIEDKGIADLQRNFIKFIRKHV
jgi:sugar-specific transcriptional regulator TrmB